MWDQSPLSLSAFFRLPTPGKIALDSATFQSGSSSIEPYDGIRDPHHCDMLQVICDHWANGSTLVMPRPKGRIGRKPPLLDKWPQDPEYRDDRALTEEGFRAVGEELLERFNESIEQRGAHALAADDLAAYVNFQFTDSIVTEYCSRFNNDREALAPICQCAPLAAKLIENKRALKLQESFAKTHWDTQIHSRYKSAMRKSQITDFSFQQSDRKSYREALLFSLSYVLSVYMRGRPYAWTFAHESAAPTDDTLTDPVVYEPLWLRPGAVAGRMDTSRAADDKEQRVPLFPWGAILRTTSVRKRLCSNQDLIDTLNHLRNAEPEFRAGLLDNQGHIGAQSEITMRTLGKALKPRISGKEVKDLKKGIGRSIGIVLAAYTAYKTFGLLNLQSASSPPPDAIEKSGAGTGSILGELRIVTDMIPDKFLRGLKEAAKGTLQKLQPLQFRVGLRTRMGQEIQDELAAWARAGVSQWLADS